MAESLTLREREKEWRERAEQLRRGPDEVSELWNKGAANSAERCANELAATLTGMTCETCKFKGRLYPFGQLRECLLIPSEAGNYVPLEVNGQPFGCLAHTPRADRDREE